jgi:hypothetical protein
MHTYLPPPTTVDASGTHLRRTLWAARLALCATIALSVGGANPANAAGVRIDDSPHPPKRGPGLRDHRNMKRATTASRHRLIAPRSRHRDMKRVTTAVGHRVIARRSQLLCPIDDLSVSESSSVGVVSEWLAYGETLRVEPYLDRIWAGIWFTGTNGPEGWSGTVAPWTFPLPGLPKYSLINRLGNGPYGYLGNVARSFTNTTPGYWLRVRFRVNDDVPGNGSGAFRVLLRYPCRNY